MNTTGSTARVFAEDDARTRAHFDALARAHGGTVSAVDWSSRASQEVRFSVLASVGDLRGSRVLDVGCGQGDLCAWLERQGIDCDYSGVDLSPAMVDLACARFPKRSFAVSNLLEEDPAGGPFGFVLASGIFYLRRTSPDEYLRSMVERMFACCSRGLAFNSLSSWGTDPGDGVEFCADPLRTLSMASRLSEKIALRHDYHPRDFTILMHKGVER